MRENGALAWGVEGVTFTELTDQDVKLDKIRNYGPGSCDAFKQGNNLPVPLPSVTILYPACTKQEGQRLNLGERRTKRLW